MYLLNELKQSLGCKLYERAKQIIPGGTQLLSKRPEMFAPGVWPSYYSKAKGSRVWDLDGREFLDMSIMSVGACILGYADDDVDAAVIEAVRSGISSSLNAPEEVELAELLVNIHPWFDMVRYCRSGGEAMSMAVRIARAATRRDKVMFSGYHGWTDWYLASNLADDSGLDGHLMPGLQPNGVPRGLVDSSVPFDANSIASLRSKIKGYEKEIAAIVIEPARGQDAGKDYLEELKNFANEIGAVLIFDEITSGFRACTGGIHKKYGVHPDVAVFAKSMANGYAMACVIGCSKVMESAQNTFISSTNWTERIGPVASLATIKKYQSLKVDEHIIKSGNSVKEIWKAASIKHEIPIVVSGLPALSSFAFDKVEKNTQQVLNTLYCRYMLEEGILGFRQFKPSLSHSAQDLIDYSEAVDTVFKKLNTAKSSDLQINELHHSGFYRLTSE